MSSAREIRKILVPTDLSDMSLAAMKYAFSLSQVYGAALYLIHVIEPITSCPAPVIDGWQPVLREPMTVTDRALNEFMTRKIPFGPNVVMIVRRGSPYREILKFADEEKIDLIAMATHGKTVPVRALLGSVVEDIVRHSQFPVLTVRPLSNQK